MNKERKQYYAPSGEELPIAIYGHRVSTGGRLPVVGINDNPDKYIILDVLYGELICELRREEYRGWTFIDVGFTRCLSEDELIYQTDIEVGESLSEELNKLKEK